MKNVDLKELALKKVKMEGNIIGKFGTFQMEQTYQNNTKEVLEVGYTFPIVETATVVGFEIYVGEKVLKGKCKEKGEAKKEYQENLVKGNSAYLMEQAAGNVFQISVGKLEAGEEVKVVIRYIDKFEITDNTIKVLIPTLVTPKYHSKITEKLFYGKVEYTVDFSLHIADTVKVKSVSCESHPFTVLEDAHEITINHYDLSKDLKLNITLKNELSSHAISQKTSDGEEIVYLSFMPEILDSYEDSEKEFVFIVDVSGSMSGTKMEATKKAVIECLRQLDEGDKFNIIPFENDFKAMSISALPYNEENFEKAEQYVKGLTANGGTEILKPVQFALYEADTEKIVLLFTDGQVGNERDIISFVQKNIHHSRIFPFGIDTNVNSYFIKELAKVGNGKAELILPNEKIDEKIIRTFVRIQTPLLENMEIDYGKNEVIDVIQEEKSLFNYELFNVFAKVKKLVDDITLKGNILGKEYAWTIGKKEIEESKANLEVLFAKEEIERLETYIRETYDDEKRKNYQEMIVALSEKYNVNSQYTSFITVYEREDKIFEVPHYQETVLSSAFMERMPQMDSMRGAILGNVAAGGARKVKANMRAFGMPAPMRETGRMEAYGIDEDLMAELENDESGILGKVKNAVKEYLEEVISQEQTLPVKIVILLLLCRSKLRESLGEVREKLLEILMQKKEEIQADDGNLQLLYLLYQEEKRASTKECEKLFTLLSKDYQKIAVTGMKYEVNISIPLMSEKELEKVIKEKKPAEKMDEILWYLWKRW